MIKIIDRLPTEEEYRLVRHLILQNPGQTGHRIADEELAAVLGECPQLESIVLSGIPDLSDRTVALLAQTAANLQGINLNGCARVTDAGILALVARPLPLQWMRLNGVANLTDQSVLAIATSCPRLVDLELCGLPLITPLSIKSVWEQLRKLRALRLAHCPLLTDEAFPSTSRWQPEEEGGSRGLTPPLRYNADNLRILDLAHCNITDKSLDGIIAHAPKIQNLNITECDQLTDMALDCICRLGESLDVLSMSRITNVTDAAVVRLARSCTKLRGVDFGYCDKLTDLSVFELASLGALRRLSLAGVHNITDIGIFAVAQQAVELERFHLAYCTQISLEAVHTLLKDLRKLQQIVLTGVTACQGGGMEQFSENPPTHIDTEERALFRVYKGKNISRLREFLDLEEQRRAEELELQSFHSFVLRAFTSSAERARHAARGPCSSSTAVDCSPSATFQPLMRPPRDEIHCVGRSGISYLRTLSPIIASPRGTPTSTFSLDSSTSHVHHGTQSPPTASLDSTLPHTSRSLSEALYSPSSLSTSTSYPAAVFLRTVHDVVAPQETRHHVRPMRPRSLSDSSLPSRLACHSLNSKQAGVSLRPDLQTNAEDTNTSFPRHRAKCHIPLDQNIEEDEGVPPLRSCQSAQNLEPFGYRNVKTGDVMRSFHALMELLTSERGYLNDLKALVQIYLRNLSGMTYRAQSLTRVPSFLATSAWMGPHSSSQSCGQLCDANSAAVLGKDRSSMIHRRLFTESEVKLLARNAEELLCLHEGFLQELEATVKFVVDPLQGNVIPNAASIDAVIGTIARIFAQQASRFHVYQDFCAGHLEALEIIRTKQHQHPVEWDAFERQCALAIQSGSMPESSVGLSPDHKMLSASDRKRTTSLDGAIRSLRVFASRENMSPSCHVRQNSHARRLMFMDYLIKPVQRICKYSLLLEQLRPVSKDDIGAVVKESIQAMKDIVATVDEARHRKDITVKSSLIASRILRSTASGYSHPLSDMFLSSLGNCLLAGSLIIVHHSPLRDFTSAKPRNLGAFLYPGGYLILAKVLKGKIYEPKHWFCLADFDVQDMSMDGTSPSIFCLLSPAHVFELTAACPGEKSVWLSTIRVSLSQSQDWIDEPISSLGLIGLCLNDSKPNLPTTQSDSGCCPANQERSDDSSCSPSGFAQNSARSRQDCNLAPTRTSSSVSLKTLFCPSTDMNFVVRRYSMTEKQQTDDGLRDVTWRACLDARVCRHDFQGVSPSFARSSSTMSLKTLTRSRFSRRETATVSRHNSLPNGEGFVSRTESMKAKYMSVRRGNRRNKDVTSISGKKGPLYARPGANTDPIISQRSTNLADSVDDPAQSLSHDLFRNVKELFQVSSTTAIDSAVPSIQASPLQRAKSANNIFRRLSSRAVFRRGISSDMKRGMS